MDGVFIRGALVGWFERLGYGANNCRKVGSSRLGFAMHDWETLSVNRVIIIIFYLDIPLYNGGNLSRGNWVASR